MNDIVSTAVGLPDALVPLVRGAAQRRWTAAMLSSDGLHHSEGKRGRWAGTVHDRIAEWVHRLRSAGFEIEEYRPRRGTARFRLNIGDCDHARGNAYRALGLGATPELVERLRRDAELCARVELLRPPLVARYPIQVSLERCVELAAGMTGPEAEIVAGLAPELSVTVEMLVDEAKATGTPDPGT